MFPQDPTQSCEKLSTLLLLPKELRREVAARLTIK